MPIYSPTGFLDITNATLRTSNLEAQNFKLNGGNIYVTSELTTDELLNLDNVVNAGNATSNTVQFTNVTTGLVADSNIVVTGNVTAGSFLGDGSGLTSIPPSAITGTLSQWSDGANGDVYIASNVGIGNVHTLTSNTLQVGANLYVRDADANVLTVTGNVAADYFEGDGSKLTGISSTLQAITDSGNVTSNTVQFSNATTGFVTTSNIEVGGALKINTITAAAYHSLQAVTNVGNVTSNTVQFSNATTGFVTTGNVEVGTANLFVDTQTSRVGLGTRTPESTLHVEGNVYVSSNLEVDGSTISTILSDQVPNVSWAKSIGATGSNDRGTGIATDSAGNVYVIGYYRDEITLGTITLTSGASTSDDAYVAKYDTSGTVLWATSIGGTSFDYGYGIATDSSGNVYVTGYYSGTAYFDINTSLNSAGGSNDVFVAKYNTSGAVQWAESIGGTSSDYGSGIATDSSGNVYVIGRYFGSTTIGTTILNSSGSNYDVFIAKYDTSGAVQWARRIGGTSSDYGYGIATDSAGNVYVTGQYQSEIIIGSTTLTNAGSSDVFVAKYDTGGTVQWAKSIGGTGSDAGNGIATDSSGNVYVTGYYNGTANFGPDTSLTSAGQNDAFVAKYDTSGTLRWAKSIGGGYGDFGYGIATDSVGNVYVTGSYQGAITIGSTTLTFTVSSGAFIARYDTNGAVQWATSIGGGSNSGIGIATDSAGNVYVTGNYEDVVDFGSGTSLTSAGNTDAFVAKYSPPVKLNINTSVDIQGDVYVSSNLEVDGSTISTTIVSDEVPNVSWARSIGGTFYDYGSAVATDSAGNVYVIGDYESIITIGSITLTSAGGEDVFVAKYDTNGAVQWATSIGGTDTSLGFGIATDSAGNVYVTGEYEGTVYFEPSTSLTSSGSNYDGFVAKYNTSGTFEWAKSIVGTGSDAGFGIATDSAGNVYVTGKYEGIANFGSSTSLTGAGIYDAFIAKYTTSGAVQWARSIGGPTADYGYAIAADSAGNVYVTGGYSDTVDFEPGTSLSSVASMDGFVAKYNTSGAVQWARSIGGTGTNFGFGIATDSAGNVYVTGRYQDIVYFEPSTSLTSVDGSNDAYVAKYNTSGSVQWARTIGGTGSDSLSTVATDSSGNVYVTGYYSGTIIIGSTTLTNAGGTDAFVTKYNTSGTVQWAKSIGGTSSDSGNGIATDSSGNVYVTGRYNGTANFGPDTSLISAGTAEGFVVKYSPPKKLNINTSVDVQGDMNVASNLEVGRDLSVTGNLTVLGTRTIVDTDTLRVKDPIIELGKNNPGTGDLGLVMTRPSGSSNVAVVFDESTDTLEIGYTQNNASDSTITMDSAPLSVNVNGNVSVGKELTVTGNVAVDTDTLFVDSVNNRVGVGTMTPLSDLDLYNPAGTELIVSRNAGSSVNPSIRLWNFDDNNYNNHAVGTSVGTINFSGNERLTGDTHTDDSRAFSYANTLYDWARISALFVGSSDSATTTQGNVRGDLAFYTNNGDGATSDLQERMRIKHNGNVGIGTSSPATKLHVEHYGSAIGDFEGIRIANHATNLHATSRPAYEFVVSDIAAGTGIGASKFAIGYRGTTSASRTDRLVIDASGNVGIGRTDPQYKLHVVGDIGRNWGTGRLIMNYDNHYRQGLHFSTANRTLSMFSTGGSGDGGTLTFNTRSASGSGDSDIGSERMRIDQNGNVGINQASPDSKLHIKPNHTSYSNPGATSGVVIYNETNSDADITHAILNLRTGGTSGGDPFISYDVAGEHGWSVGIDNSAGRQLRFGESWANFNSTRAYISQGSTANEIDFTGQHRSFIDTIAHTDYLKYEGLIVSANKNQYFDIQEEIVTGVQAIKINESLPLVSISNVAYDKCCFGVISGSEDTNDREYSQGSFVSVLKKQDGDIRAHVNSVGEGAIWVVNTNGILESGDYITTSNVAGYGQKQDSEFLANYTVAKITMDCDFNPSTQPTRIIKRELRDVNYWVKYTYDDISEEEYTRVKNLGRRVRIIEGGTEISREEYENHLKKEGYTETESTYIRNETTHQRVFSDKKMEPTDGFNLEVRNEPVNVLDEHGQIQWEDDPSGATEKAYKIRYLDADGNITDEANHVHKAAFVGCTYHCG